MGVYINIIHLHKFIIEVKYIIITIEPLYIFNNIKVNLFIKP